MNTAQHGISEAIHVPEHTAYRLTILAEGGDWVFTEVRTGCVRVQRGDFCAYIPVHGLIVLRDFLNTHLRRLDRS